MRLRRGHPVVEHRSTIHFAGEGRRHLTRLDSADFAVRGGVNARWRAATLDTLGNVSFARLGREGTLERETPAQSAAHAPVISLLVLHDAAGDERLFFGLRWTANYRIRDRSLGDRTVAIEAGIRMTGDPLVDPLAAVGAAPGFLIRPGQTIATPWLILGLFDGGMEDATLTLKRYLSDDRPCEPRWAEDVLPVAGTPGLPTAPVSMSPLCETRLAWHATWRGGV